METNTGTHRQTSEGVKEEHTVPNGIPPSILPLNAQGTQYRRRQKKCKSPIGFGGFKFQPLANVYKRLTCFNLSLNLFCSSLLIFVLLFKQNKYVLTFFIAIPSACTTYVLLSIFFVKLTKLERDNFNWENVFIRLACRSVFVKFSWLMIDVGSATPRHLVRARIKEANCGPRRAKQSTAFPHHLCFSSLIQTPVLLGIFLGFLQW